MESSGIQQQIAQKGKELKKEIMGQKEIMKGKEITKAKAREKAKDSKAIAIIVVGLDTQQ